jgi:DNA polymerase-3 subunit delta'
VIAEFSPWQQRLWDRAFEARSAGRLPHALLVCGPARLGKRELAEQLARALLCPSAGHGGGCGSCASCRGFDARYQRDPPETRPDDSPAHPRGHPGHPDARFVGFVLNEKSSPKKMYQELVIEQVRDLSGWLVLSPQRGETKVALIEPAHRLTHAAANALLKTLEEPVPGRYLLLVTEEPHRLPATIRSRCQRLEMKLPPRDEARAWMLAQGAAPHQVDEALDFHLGHPGLALDELRGAGAALRRTVVADLVALATGREPAHAVASRWQDEDLAVRLSLAAAALRDQAVRDARGTPQDGALRRAGLPPGIGARALADGFDQVNLVRQQLRTTLRQDLMLGELLRHWTRACRTGPQGAKMLATGHRRG